MKKRCRTIAALICLGFSTLSCAPGQAQPFHSDSFVMGTLVSQQIYGDNARQVSEEVFAELSRLEMLMTINAPGGDINKLNDNAGQGYVSLEPETIQVLQSARKIAELSQGAAFDITVAPLVKAWGIGTEDARVPSAATIERLTALVDYRDVQIDEDQGQARLQKPGQMADLGGIAKGYAGDAVREIYRRRGIVSACINIGGNVVVLGHRPDGSDWSIGIQNPRSETGEIVGFVRVADQAVVTSGDYQRYFIAEDGRRFCHIIDPQTGYPADSGLMSATIITASSTEADGLSKAFVLGLEEGLELVRRYGQAEAIFITTDKKIYVTPGLKGNFQFEDRSHEYTYVQEG